jgi:hypothetical protein
MKVVTLDVTIVFITSPYYIDIQDYFFAHVQTGPGAHPSFCTMGTGSFPGVKQPGRGADHPLPSSAEVENEWSYTSTPPLGHEACYRVNFTFYRTVAFLGAA